LFAELEEELFTDEGLDAAIAAADAEDADGFDRGGMDDDDDSATAAPSSSAAPKVVIKREPGEDNQFVKRLKQGEKIIIDLD
jgi:hypothetical protein